MARHEMKEGMRVLLVAHGFPPEQFGGTEVYTHSLAKELVRQGLEVHALYSRFESWRGPTNQAYARDESPSEFQVGPDGLAAITYVTESYEQDGVSCWRVPVKEHYLTSLEDTYRNPFIDLQFHTSMQIIKPDIVHFMYLQGGLSASMVPIARSFGVPVVVTLTDFVLMCPRGQLLRSDGTRCDGPGDSTICANCLREMAGQYEYLYWLRDISSPPTQIPQHHRLVELVARAMTSFPATSQSKKRLIQIVSGTSNSSRQLNRQVQLREDTAAGREALGNSSAGHDGRRSDLARTQVEYMRRADYLKWVLNQCDAVITPTPFLSRKFEEWGMDRRIAHLSEYGIDPDPFRSFAKIPCNHLRFGFIGQILPHKGLGVLLEAFSRLNDPWATLMVYGDTTYPPAREYYRKIEHLAAKTGVRMAGTFPPEKIAEVLAGLDVLVIPSIWAENSPLVVRNALLARLPIIASNVEGLTVYVHNGQNGLTFEPGDTQGLLECLTRFSNEPGLVKQLSEGTPPTKTISEDAEQLLGIYRQLAAGRFLSYWENRCFE